MSVTDRDSNPLLYEIIDVGGGGIDWLTIDPNNGDLHLTAQHEFDFESGSQYSIEARVTETIPNGTQVTGVIPITLTNANDPPTGVAALSIYPLRFGTPVASDFTVIDQDPAPLKYTITTSDNRFEVRNGRLALKPTELQDINTVGQTFKSRSVSLTTVIQQALPMS